MATKKRASTTKKPSKAAKKTAKRPAKVAKKTARKASAPAKRAPVLTAEERKRLLHPRTNYDEMVAQVARIWESARHVRVPGLTAAKLARLEAAASKARLREAVMRETMEAKLQPLTDARLLAEDGMWRALLDLWAEVKHAARREPALLETFAALGEAVAPSAGATRARDDEPSDPPAVA